MLKAKYYLSYIFLFSFLFPWNINANGGLLDKNDNLELLRFINETSEEALIEEGRKQLSELIAYNAANMERGCPEDNVYFFSLSKEDSWIEYLRVNGDNDTELDNGLDVVDLNAKLQEAAIIGKPIFVCLVTSMPVEVAGYFAVPNKISDIIRAYEQQGTNSGDASAINVKALRTKYNVVLTNIFSGHGDLTGINEYTQFVNSTPDKLLLSAINIHATQFTPSETDPTYENSRVRIKKTAGHYKTYDSQLTDYIKSFTATPNPLERDIVAAVEFVVTEQHSPETARNVIRVDDYPNLDDYTTTQTNEQDLSVSNNSLFLYDFAGVYNNDPTLKDLLKTSILNGSMIGTDSKMKLFITNSATNSTVKNEIANLDLSLTVHQNSMIVWMDIKSDGKIEHTIRYSPDLYDKVNAYVNRASFQITLEKSLAEMASEDLQTVLKFSAECVFWTFSFVSEMLEKNAIIPAKYYRVDTVGYNPNFKRVFKVLMPVMFTSDLIQPIINELDPSLTANTDLDDLNFAFVCGLWNGIINEIKGASDLVKMASGAFVDEKTKEDLSKLYGKLCEGPGSIWDMVKTTVSQAHNGPPCKVVHQIGKDIVFVGTTFVPIVGAFTKFNKLSTAGSITKVCTGFANAMDVINPLTYAFKGIGCVVKKGANGVVIIGKKVGNDLDKMLMITDGTILLTQRYYVASRASLEAGLGPIDDLVLKARIVFWDGQGPPPFQFKLANADGTPGQAIEMGTDEFLLFAKKNGEPGSQNTPPERIVKGNFLDDIVGPLRQRFLNDADNDLNIASLFGNQADEISTKLAKLSNANKLLDDAAIRDAIKALPEPKRKQFYQDLAEAADPADVGGGHIGLNLEQVSDIKISIYGELSSNPFLRKSITLINETKDWAIDLRQLLLNKCDLEGAYPKLAKEIVSDRTLTRHFRGLFDEMEINGQVFQTEWWYKFGLKRADKWAGYGTQGVDLPNDFKKLLDDIQLESGLSIGSFNSANALGNSFEYEFNELLIKVFNTPDFPNTKIPLPEELLSGDYIFTGQVRIINAPSTAANKTMSLDYLFFKTNGVGEVDLTVPAVYVDAKLHTSNPFSPNIKNYVRNNFNDNLDHTVDYISPKLTGVAGTAGLKLDNFSTPGLNVGSVFKIGKIVKVGTYLDLATKEIKLLLKQDKPNL